MNSKEKFLHSIGLSNNSKELCINIQRRDTRSSILYKPPFASNDSLLTLCKLGVLSGDRCEIKKWLREFSPRVILNYPKLESLPINVNKLDVPAESNILIRQKNGLGLRDCKSTITKCKVLTGSETRSTMCIDLCSEVGRKLHSIVHKQLRKQKYLVQNHVETCKGFGLWYDEYCGISYPVTVTDSRIETRRSSVADYIVAYNPGRSFSGFVHEYHFNKRQRLEFCRRLDTGLNAHSRHLRKQMKPCQVMLQRLSLETIEYWAHLLERKVDESSCKIEREHYNVSLFNLLGECMFCGQNCTCVKPIEKECAEQSNRDSLRKSDESRPMENLRDSVLKTQPVLCSVSLCKSQLCDSVCITALSTVQNCSSSSCTSLSDISTCQELSIDDNASSIDDISTNHIPVKACLVELRKCDIEWQERLCSRSRLKSVTGIRKSSNRHGFSQAVVAIRRSRQCRTGNSRGISSRSAVPRVTKGGDLSSTVASKCYSKLMCNAAPSSPKSTKSDDVYTLPLTPQSCSECHVI